MAATVLITGSSGLLGAHVRRLWGDVLPDLVPVFHQRTDGDLLSPGVPSSLVASVRPVAVLHLAWSASGRPDYRTTADNDRWVDASLELRQACRDHGARLVLTGTSLDDQPAGDAYSASKARLRAAVAEDIREDGVAWLRPYYVVDPARGRPALVRDANDAIAAGRPVELRTPDDEHDFIHAADVAVAALAVVRSGIGGEVPVGSGTLRPVRDLVRALGATWRQADPQVTTGPHHHEPADTRRLADLGWSATNTEELFSGD